MGETANLEAAGDSSEGEISDFDAASYIFQISAEMASMADAHGFWKLAAALELARSMAAEAIAEMSLTRQAPSRNAAPEEAT